MGPITLSASNGDLVIRQLSTVEDDVVLFEAQNQNIDHVAEFANTIYKSVEEVTQARLNDGWVKLGIWRDGQFLGLESFKPSNDATEAEVGIWLVKEATGQGYATSALGALSAYLLPKYQKVFAETKEDNEKSAHLLERIGFKQTAHQAGMLTFELVATR